MPRTDASMHRCIRPRLHLRDGGTRVTCACVKVRLSGCEGVWWRGTSRRGAEGGVRVSRCEVVWWRGTLATYITH